ncbi:MAG TPA: hypothetical protein PK899_06820, partial [Spirochaetota bacterium]|nr:hypothetical protein [Spirochaetota bacterium]
KNKRGYRQNLFHIPAFYQLPQTKSINIYLFPNNFSIGYFLNVGNLFFGGGENKLTHMELYPPRRFPINFDTYGAIRRVAP